MNKKIEDIVLEWVGMLVIVGLMLAGTALFIQKGWEWVAPHVGLTPLSFIQALGLTTVLSLLGLIGAWGFRHFQEPYDGLPK